MKYQLPLRRLFVPLSLATAVALTACGGSSGGDSSNNDNAAGSADLNTGVFLDSPVGNIAYSTESQSNQRTNADGEFKYLEGETITFYIGDLALPPIPVGALVTPLDMTNGGVNDPVVINVARLLQSLDSDGDPSNGITLIEAAHENAAGLEVDFASDSFDADVANLVANGTEGVTTTLISAGDAIDHLTDTISRQANEVNLNGTWKIYESYNVCDNDVISHYSTATISIADGEFNFSEELYQDIIWDGEQDDYICEAIDHPNKGDIDEGTDPWPSNDPYFNAEELQLKMDDSEVQKVIIVNNDRIQVIKQFTVPVENGATVTVSSFWVRQ